VPDKVYGQRASVRFGDGAEEMGGDDLFRRDDEVEVPDAGLLDPGKVDLVHDAVAHGEPEPASDQSAVPTADFTLEVQRGSMPGAPGARDPSSVTKQLPPGRLASFRLS
jgi:hypothetical protein